jgi:hypothetical protein
MLIWLPQVTSRTYILSQGCQIFRLKIPILKHFGRPWIGQFWEIMYIAIWCISLLFVLFYGHLVYLLIICSILWLFGTFCEHLGAFFMFWYVVPKKNLATLFGWWPLRFFPVTHIIIHVHTSMYFFAALLCDYVIDATTQKMWMLIWGGSAWGRCYDHNYLRFLPIFGEKNGVFLKNHCYDQIFA